MDGGREVDGRRDFGREVDTEREVELDFFCRMKRGGEEQTKDERLNSCSVATF